jgi:hypothetical protein
MNSAKVAAERQTPPVNQGRDRGQAEHTATEETESIAR